MPDDTADGYVDAIIKGLTWIDDQVPGPLWWILLGGATVWVIGFIIGKCRAK
jgi:hypothetical protein